MSDQSSSKIIATRPCAKSGKQVVTVRLQPINPESELEMAQLRRQRYLCGWASDSVDKWRDMIRHGDRLMYWVFDDEDDSFPNEPEPRFLEPLDPASEKEIIVPDLKPDPRFHPVGHIALDWFDYLGDTTLADRSAKKITFTSLYILMSRRGRGYASAAMDELERIAREDLGCKTITLNTLPSRYLVDPGWWASQGYKKPLDTPVYEDWYARRGYRKFAEVPRHRYKTLDGKEHMVPCSNMEKEL